MAPTGAHPEVKRVTVMTLAWNTRTPLATIFANGWKAGGASLPLLPRREAAGRGQRHAAAIFTVGSHTSSCRSPLSMAAAVGEEGGAALPSASPCAERESPAGTTAPHRRPPSARITLSAQDAPEASRRRGGAGLERSWERWEATGIPLPACVRVRRPAGSSSGLWPPQDEVLSC
ncbi:uncharacterized protein LOC129204904 isoform X2 [Grus americana]|uniref:uncharacterized protein LOC129204904 isoform X2 n=1 Tax=Grus americana TaxID=9117 RepID=UPI002407B85E|nr:uncharacterized protein LOC129204904 isoform X2 [Grus americana]